MVNFNRVVLGGNLTRDPELRFTQAGVPVCSFGIAVNRVRSRNEEVDFFDVSAWRELGQTVANYKKKGDPILVEGRLQYRTWEAQDGSLRGARLMWSPTTSSSSGARAVRKTRKMGFFGRARLSSGEWSAFFLPYYGQNFAEFHTSRH
jgi:single-strand DNA-binding protein